jgi:hypothetical protein
MSGHLLLRGHFRSWHKADAARCPMRVRNALKSRHRARSCGYCDAAAAARSRHPQRRADESQNDCPTGKSPNCLSSPARKNIPVHFRPKSPLHPPYPALTRGGVSRSSRTLRRDAMDADGATDESADSRTAKSCGPDTPTLVSSS